jgi:hypothetical protein
MKKQKRSSKTKAASKKTKGFDHECDWRTAAIKLAQCVALTLRTNGKIGVGSGLVMKVVDGKKVVERWDKDFIEALAFIGIEVVDKPKPASKSKTTKAKTRGSLAA